MIEGESTRGEVQIHDSGADRLQTRGREKRCCLCVPEILQRGATRESQITSRRSVMTVGSSRFCRLVSSPVAAA